MITGLPYAEYGCEVDENMKIYTNAYNYTVRLAIEDGRVKARRPQER